MRQNSGLSQQDRVRIAEAFRISREIGSSLWTTWESTPFAVLLVTPEYEYLIRHPEPSSDFCLLHHDPLLESDVYSRETVYPSNLQAAFPAINNIPTIVIGQAENTHSQASTPWVMTLLHEYFHLLQMSLTGYGDAVKALGLSRGDTGGQWMLDYAFPYESPEVVIRFEDLGKHLKEALNARDTENFAAKLAEYRVTRAKLHTFLQSDDYRYFAFQLWQEGIARYTEYRLAQEAARLAPGKDFQELPDYTPYADVPDVIFKRIIEPLSPSRLDQNKRVTFYAVGAGEALLLDQCAPGWRDRYFVDKFDTGTYFQGE